LEEFLSELKVNQISKRSGNNISLSDPLRLKSYTTTERDALTGLNNGDMIFNSTEGKAQIYGSSAWTNAGGIEGIEIDYLLVGGGGAGGRGKDAYRMGGGGGAGAVLSTITGDPTAGTEGSTQPKEIIQTGTSYNVTVGAGAAIGGGTNNAGGVTNFATRFAIGGGGANGYQQISRAGASAGGNGDAFTPQFYTHLGHQAGGSAGSGTTTRRSGGGGAGENGGTDGTGTGGDGITTSIITSTEATTYSVGQVDGSDVYFGGGGSGGGAQSSGGNIVGGLGGGGTGVTGNGGNGSAGTANTGGGGGGAGNNGGAIVGYGGAGGSGVVILRYPNSLTISVGAGLTSSTFTQGTNKVTIFTAGDDTISWS